MSPLQALSRGRPPLSRLLAIAALAIGLAATGEVAAQSAEVSPLPVRDATLYWETPESSQVFLNVSYRDAIDDSLQRKLRRGLPTTIVMTAALFPEFSTTPVATTAQTCRVTWHVWEEAYRLEIQRPGELKGAAWTTTVEGVLRRCAEAHHLLAASRTQLTGIGRVRGSFRVMVNPVDEEVLQKIRHWISRPAGTGIVAPGDALFSTFAGLFLQRVGTAERELSFESRPTAPKLALPPGNR
jgi:hypothetical protein